MVGSMRSSDSGGYSGNGGQDSPSESKGGPGSGAGSSSNSPSSSGNNGGLGGPTSNNSGNKSSSSSSSGGSGGLNSAGNRASGAGPGASGNRSTTGGGFSGSGGSAGNSNANGGGGNGGGLNSAGNRASGAGPGASSNTSTTGGGYGSTTGGGMAGGLNAAGNRASGAGPGASANRTTTGGGFGSQTDSERRADMAQQARASENTSMSNYNAARSLSQDNARRADLAQQARSTETQSMNSMADWGKEVKSVVDAGAGWTTVTLNNGMVETRKGDRASRNNNPGNIEAGDFAKKHGAVGDDGRFAVFASREDGLKAISSLLATSRYSTKTVEGAISSYAPPSENNTAAYASKVASAIGVSKDTPMSSLTAAQREAMAKAITGVEGNTGYAVSKTTGTDRFASTYMGGKATSTASSTTASATSTNTSQQNDPSGLPAGTYPGHVVGNGIAPTFAGPTKQAAAAPNAPAAPAPAAPAPTPTPAPRSLGQKVAAAGIDIGLGMMPGVGTAVSVINGGLALTGNRTLGEHLVDSFANGEGGAGPNSGADRPGRGGGDRIVEEKSTAPEKSESFEDRYMKFVDPTPRPKPGERWGYDSSGYA